MLTISLGCVQTDATLLDVTCCVRLHTLLRVVGQSLKPAKLFSQQLPTFLLFRDRRSVAQQCSIRLHSSSNVVGVMHAHYAEFTDLWVVSFPRCTAGPNIVGSCCVRLHATLLLDVLYQQGDVDQVDSSPLRPRKDVLTKQYKKKHHGSPIVPPLELYKLQQQDSLPDYAQLSPRERYDGLSTDEALLSPRTRPLTVDTRTIPHECPPSPPHQQVEHSWFERRLVLTFLACIMYMFCFLNTGHGIIL